MFPLSVRKRPISAGAKRNVPAMPVTVPVFPVCVRFFEKCARKRRYLLFFLLPLVPVRRSLPL